MKTNVGMVIGNRGARRRVRRMAMRGQSVAVVSRRGAHIMYGSAMGNFGWRANDSRCGTSRWFEGKR